MPAWWGRKSCKTKEETQQNVQGNLVNSMSKSDFSNSNSNGSSKRKVCKGDRPISFDDSSRNSPRGSKDFGLASGTSGGSSGFSGFDSDSIERRGHPLPRPSVILMQSDQLGCGSGSVSSVSSSGSSEDHHAVNDQSTPSVGYRGQAEIKFNAGSRSPGPALKAPTSPTSPLHSRFGATSIDSPTSQGHPLPLPPGSPSSPSTFPSTRSSGTSESIPCSFPSSPSTFPSTRSSGTPESIPCSLTKWKKGRLLGRGTFGHVYLGFNSQNGQMCAIKEVRLVSDDQTSKECLKQLNQEINLLSQLSQSNIVRYYGSELGEEALSVYLEYVSGGSIHKLLQEYGPFREPVIQNYARQIVCGLAYLHGRNTVHRDIKGANILVDPNGEIKLADFGMAKHITSCSSMLSFKGSPYWMAPEVVMNTNGYSLAVDIWSLGCTILEMATSKPPWSQYEGVAAIFKIGNSKDMPNIPDHLSNDAKSFVKLCLQRDPSARPTAAQLLDHCFIRDLATTRVANLSIAREAFPHNFDGTRTPPSLEIHSNRGGITPDGEYSSRLMATSRAVSNPRDNVRMNMSLPVSPCSSPLRQYGPSHNSCFLSPQHPRFPLVGKPSYNVNDYSTFTLRPSTRYTQEPCVDASLFKVQTTPGGGSSPNTRQIIP